MIKLFIYFTLFLIASCSSSPKETSTSILKKELRSFEIGCKTGQEKKDCSLFLKLYSVIYSPGEAVVLANNRCANKEPFFCYLSPSISYYHGQITSSKSTLVNLCSQNDTPSCYMLGYLQLFRDFKNGTTKSNKEIKKTCSLGDVKGCITDYMYNGNEDKDLKEFNKIIRHHFNKSNSDFDDGIVLLQHIKAKNKKVFDEHLSTFCAFGSESSCFLKEYDRVLSPKDNNKAYRLSSDYCKKNSPIACSKQCEYDIAKNDHEILSCNKSCSLGYHESCLLLAKYELSLKNEQDAEIHLRFGCTLGDINSCRTLAQVYEKSFRNDKATPLYKILCDLGVNSNCEQK